MTKYNIYNPSTARRVIYSGLDGAHIRPIEIPPDEIKEGVELSDTIAEELMLRHEKDPRNELKLVEHVEAPVDPVDPPEEDNGQQGDRRPAMKMQVDDDKIGVIKGQQTKGRR